MRHIDHDSTRADESASRLEQNVAENAMATGDYSMAWTLLNQALHRLVQQPASSDRDTGLINASLNLAKVCFVLGKGFEDLSAFLSEALTAADRIGDRRSMAMINLHLGRLYYFSNQRHLAMDVFARGKTEVEALGDEDILFAAAELIGLYFFSQGFFKDAMVYFEKAAKGFEFGEQGHSGPMWLSYCAAFLGQYHRAIGTLDYYRRLAMERGNHSLAATLRAVLGITLVRIKKTKDAAYHLCGALKEASTSQNSLAGYFAKGGMAFYHMTEGRLSECHQWMIQTVEEGTRAGLISQYASPFALEMLFEFHRNKLPPIQDFSFYGECQRLLHEPNIHLQGVVLRLLALDSMNREEPPLDAIEDHLKQSEALLKRSGNPIQLGKTRIAMARLKISQGDLPSARHLSQQAWKGFSGYGDIFFPDDLRQLLTNTVATSPEHAAREELLEMFSNMIHDLIPSDEPTGFLQQTVSATNRFFGAERGGIFWLGGKPSTDTPTLRAACNLFASDVDAHGFRPSLELILKACRENQPQVVRNSGGLSRFGQIRAMMVVPLMVNGAVRGVLYHDNAYVNDCFDRFTHTQLLRMAQSLSHYIGHILDFNRKLEAQTSDRLSRMGRLDEREIVGQSAEIQTVLDQSDRIAATDGTVLILGETGVGKELLARRIHNRSHRREHPLVVVDPTAIPDALMESELFGHEKGAFTGADRQKPGRIELAHNGTLFIDEVGEIPLHIQVKLLRAFQEKTIMRIGGSKSISSNFRLLAATNRNLTEEVAAGRFREDLYYRLNVIPIVLPPLRKRRTDIPLLARHMLNQLSEKYKRAGLALAPDQLTVLMSYDWPGNVRELENIIERAVLLSDDNRLELSLPAPDKGYADNPFDDLPTLDEIQCRYIAYVLEKTSGKIGGADGAAELLGMKRSSLYNRMRKLGMR